MHLGGVVLLLAILGNAILWMTLLGLVYRLAMSHRVWTLVLAVGVTTALVTSGMMLRQVGLRGPKLLQYDRWHRTPAAWQFTILASAGVALTWMAFAGTRRFRYRAPSLVEGRISAIDVADVLGERPAAPGFGRFVARLPGNEVYQLDVIELEVLPPRLPAELDGLSIVQVSDPHFNGTPGIPYFEKVCETAAQLQPQLFVVTGDILDRLETASWLSTTFARLRAPLGNYFILGNHDVDTGADAVRRAMIDAGWTSLGGTTQSIDIRGRRILIAGTERPWIGAHPDISTPQAHAGLHSCRYSQRGQASENQDPDAITPTRSEQSDDVFRILLSHTPYNLRWARRNNFDLMLAGHLHGGQVWRRRHLAGVIERPPTILHLSRGVGEMTPPIRWRCRPEITRLVLRAPAMFGRA